MKPKIFKTFDFSGGVETSKNPMLLADNESPSLNNCYLKDGKPTKREGYVKYNDAVMTGNVGGMGTFYPAAGANQIIAVTTDSTKTYTYSIASGTITAVTSGSQTTVDTHSLEFFLGSYEYAQRFTPGETASLKQIKLQPWVHLTPPVAMIIELAIYDDDGTSNYPGTKLSETVSKTIDISMNDTWVTFELTTPITVTNGSNYWIHVGSVNSILHNVWGLKGQVVGSGGLFAYKEALPWATSSTANLGYQLFKIATAGDTTLEETNSGTINNTRFFFAQAFGKLYWTGEDEGHSWNGTAKADWNFATDMTKPYYCCFHRERLWQLGGPDFPTRGCYSGLSVDTYTANNFIEFGKNDGQPVAGAVSYMDNLIIFKEYSTYILRGSSPDDWVASLFSGSRGTRAPMTIASSGDAVFYLDNEGVYMLVNTQFYKISQPIDSAIDATSHSDMANCSGDYFEGNYYLTLPTGTTYVYDTELSTYQKPVWHISTFPNPFSCYVNMDTGTDLKMYRGSTTDVYVSGGTEDNTADISLSYFTKQLHFGAPEGVKILKKVKIFATPSSAGNTLTLNTIADGVSSSHSLTLTSGTQQYIHDVGDRGRIFQLQFTETSDDDLAIDGYEVYYTPLRGVETES